MCLPLNLTRSLAHPPYCRWQALSTGGDPLWAPLPMPSYEDLNSLARAAKMGIGANRLARADFVRLGGMEAVGNCLFVSERALVLRLPGFSRQSQCLIPV